MKNLENWKMIGIIVLALAYVTFAQFEARMTQIKNQELSSKVKTLEQDVYRLKGLANNFSGLELFNEVQTSGGQLIYAAPRNGASKNVMKRGM